MVTVSMTIVTLGVIRCQGAERRGAALRDDDEVLGREALGCTGARSGPPPQGAAPALSSARVGAHGDPHGEGAGIRL